MQNERQIAAGEILQHHCENEKSVNVYEVVDTKAAPYSLGYGNIVTVDAVYGNYGRIVDADGNEVGWADLTCLRRLGRSSELKKGDINGDGNIDKYDLSLLNEYLKKLAALPAGISDLRSCEIKAADINGDGCVDGGDVIEYLKIVCY